MRVIMSEYERQVEVSDRAGPAGRCVLEIYEVDKALSFYCANLGDLRTVARLVWECVEAYARLQGKRREEDYCGDA